MNNNVIGGADEATKIFITSSISSATIGIAAIICIVVAGIIIWTIKKRKNKY